MRAKEDGPLSRKIAGTRQRECHLFEMKLNYKLMDFFKTYISGIITRA